MKPIQSLHINYFKFFADNAPIEINGKHVLLYGENGSGKSSIYWALYTLLEAVYKTDAEINKYFMITHDDSLVNLHAKLIADSFVSLELSDRTIYRIGYDNSSIRQNSHAEATLRGSDFMNYRFMFKISDHRHHDEIDLFPLFEKEVFPYIKTRNAFQLIHGGVNEVFDFNEIWDDLKKGRYKDDFDKNISINGEVEQKRYADQLRRFVSELSSLAQEININGNYILQEDLEYDKIRFEITCIQEFNKLGGRGDLAGKEGDFPVGFPKIKLGIPEYNGFTNAIKKPQSFLNEAKLTAIGIAIRFAILARRLDYADGADFQLLVMDDLLISLDMSNRRKVLDMLLNKYADKFQLFILTHDRGFYNFAQKKIKVEYGKEKEWEMIEMYQDNLSPHPKPYIKKQVNKLKKAEDYFNEHDYPACGLYLRTECERVLDEILPDKFNFSVKVNSDEHDGSNSKKLNDQIKSLEGFCNYEGIDFQPFKELKIYKDVILNTLAHNDIESPLYSQELKAIINILKDLAKIKRGKKILDSGKDLLVELTDPSIQGQIKLSIRTREGFVLVEEEGKLPRLSNFGKCELRKFDTGAGWVNLEQGYDDIKSLIDDYKNQLGINQEYELLDLIQYRGNPLRNKIQNP
ncbi:MAG: AAA family ATPase [Flavobacterium sp.]